MSRLKTETSRQEREQLLRELEDELDADTEVRVAEGPGLATRTESEGTNWVKAGLYVGAAVLALVFLWPLILGLFSLIASLFKLAVVVVVIAAIVWGISQFLKKR